MGWVGKGSEKHVKMMDGKKDADEGYEMKIPAYSLTRSEAIKGIFGINHREYKNDDWDG